jgi:hypothetical protein
VRWCGVRLEPSTRVCVFETQTARRQRGEGD